MPRGQAPTCDCGACEKCRRRDYQREYMREYRRRRPLTDEQRQRARARSADWIAANPERAREQARRYRERADTKVKRDARLALNNAIRRGEIQRQPCEVCGTELRVHGHHDDYTKPLDVRWLCVAHHMAVHAEAA